MPHQHHELPAIPVTSGPGQNFFGYYDKTPWDNTQRYLLCTHVDIDGRQPQPEDVAEIQLIDMHDSGHRRTLATTSTWCWQQGCQLRWLPAADGQPQTQVIYNSHADGRYISIVHDIHTGEKRTLPRPIYSVSPDGRYATSLNYSRLDRLRPGYGYGVLPDPTLGVERPDDDGLYILDLHTGEDRLILSLAQIAAARRDELTHKGEHWINNLAFSTDGQRIAFLNRVKYPDVRGWQTCLFTVNRDGSDLFLLNPPPTTSHFDWRDEDHILAWATREGERASHYQLFADRTERVQTIAKGILTADGHCNYSPDRRWLVTDTYPDHRDRKQTLILFRPEDHRRVDIGRFHAPPDALLEARCDLHPRWSPDGQKICIDSRHEGMRQMYVLDVSEIVG